MGRIATAVALVAIGISSLAAQAASAAPGSLDRSFGGGIVSVQPPLSDYGVWSAQQAASGPNGRPYVLEESSRCVSGSHCSVRGFVTRYGNNGRLDASYGANGNGFGLAFEAPGNFAPAAIAVDKSGRVVVAQGGEEGLTLTRLGSTGAVDPTFGVGGHASYPCKCTMREIKISILKTGKISVAATRSFLNFSGPVSYADFEGELIVQTTKDGQPEIAFGETGGTLFVPKMEIQGPWMLRSNGAIIVSEGKFLTRIAPDGSSIQRDWGVALRLKQPGSYTSLAPLPNGDIAVVGRGNYRGSSYVAELHPSGALVRKFGKKGFARFSTRLMYSGAVDSHGRILLAGNNGGKPFVMRLLPRGRIDRGFHNGLKGINVETEYLEAMYAGPRPLVFDAGGEEGCRAYCKPHPVLYRFKGGPGGAHRR